MVSAFLILPLPQQVRLRPGAWKQRVVLADARRGAPARVNNSLILLHGFSIPFNEMFVLMRYPCARPGKERSSWDLYKA
jgi:hypothetical protein